VTAGTSSGPKAVKKASLASTLAPAKVAIVSTWPRPGRIDATMASGEVVSSGSPRVEAVMRLARFQLAPGVGPG
jgi:hypothetical protein